MNTLPKVRAMVETLQARPELAVSVSKSNSDGSNSDGVRPIIVDFTTKAFA